MNFRLILMTTGLLTASALAGACSRDELAPWGFPRDIGLACETLPGGVVGRPYMFDLNTLVSGGAAPYSWTASGLPDGLVLDPTTGVIAGTPTTAGDFDELVITVTDSAGETRTFDNCGNIVIDPADEATCRDDTGTIPDGFNGVQYDWPVSFTAGRAPYQWVANGLPAGLTLVPDANDTSKATVTGIPTVTGDFDVELVVTDADGTVSTTQCGLLQVRDPVQVDHGNLLADVDGCVPVGDGDFDSLDDLLAQGILTVDNDNLYPISCELKTGRGNGSGDFDRDKMTPDTMPPGINFDAASCTVGGAVTGTLAYGIYGFISTYTQSTGASTVSAYVPYCAPNMTQAPNAYDIMREDGVDIATFLPGVLSGIGPGNPVVFGSDVPDPKVTVNSMGCGNNTCFYVFVFSYNTLSSSMDGGSVSASPNASFPNPGFEGFTHAVRIGESNPTLLERFQDRAWIVNVTFDYCVTSDPDGCGRNEADSATKANLVRQEGNGSNYYFSLVLLP